MPSGRVPTPKEYGQLGQTYGRSSKQFDAYRTATQTGIKAAVEAAEKGVINNLKGKWATTKKWAGRGAWGMTAAYASTAGYFSLKYDIPYIMGVSIVNRWLHDEAGIPMFDWMLGEIPADMKKRMEAGNRDMKQFGITPEQAAEEIRKQREMQRKIRVDENYITQRVMNNLLTALNQPSARISK